MKCRLVTFGPLRAFVVKPRENAYGHQALEILMGLYLAEHLNAPACFLRPRRVANRAIFDLECREVRIVRGLRARVARRLGERLELAADAPGEASLAAGRAGKPRRVKARPADLLGLDFRERYARHPLTLSFRGRNAAEADRQARALGIAADARLVALHVRESGFKVADGGEGPADAMRNARIEAYAAAVALVVARGYTVVRIGDPTMTPITWDGVVDLATSDRRTDLLEVALLKRAEFFIAGDSGPCCASLLTSTPCLAVNVTNVIGAYPLRLRDRYLLKRVRDRRYGRCLSLREMLTEEYFERRKDPDRYEVIDNTPEELNEAVGEMLDVVAGKAPVGQAQLDFKALAEQLQNAPAVAARRTKKGEPARQFLGDGYLCRRFAEQDL